MSEQELFDRFNDELADFVQKVFSDSFNYKDYPLQDRDRCKEMFDYQIRGFKPYGDIQQEIHQNLTVLSKAIDAIGQLREKNLLFHDSSELVLLEISEHYGNMKRKQAVYQGCDKIWYDIYEVTRFIHYPLELAEQQPGASKALRTETREKARLEFDRLFAEAITPDSLGQFREGLEKLLVNFFHQIPCKEVTQVVYREGSSRPHRRGYKA